MEGILIDFEFLKKYSFFRTVGALLNYLKLATAGIFMYPCNGLLKSV
jgi:hypothetical protein